MKWSVQNCENVDTLIQCGEYDKLRVVYSKSKLSSQEKELTMFLDRIRI